MNMWDRIRAGLTINRQATPENIADNFVPYPQAGGTLGLGTSRLSAIPAAYAAINLLSSQLAILPRVIKDGDTELPGHQISAVLAAPNRTIDPAQFWNMIMTPFVANGNAYAHIRRDFRTKDIIELVPAECINAEYVDSRSAPYVRYRLNLLGGNQQGRFTHERQITTNSNNVLAFHGPGFDGLKSPSPIMYAARAVLGIMAEVYKYQHGRMTEGLTAGNVMVVRSEWADIITPEKYKDLKDILEESYKGARNAGKTPFLPPGVEIKEINLLSSHDMQLIELLKWGVEDIARVFGVSPIRLGHYYQGMRVTGFELQAEDFTRYGIAPRIHRIDAQLNYKMRSMEDILMGLTISSSTNNLSSGSLSERIISAEMAVSRGGIMTINEGRKLMGLPPRPDGDRLMSPKGAPAQGDNINES